MASTAFRVQEETRRDVRGTLPLTVRRNARRGPGNVPVGTVAARLPATAATVDPTVTGGPHIRTTLVRTPQVEMQGTVDWEQ